MKRYIVILVVLSLIMVSFFAGKFTKEREYTKVYRAFSDGEPHMLSSTSIGNKVDMHGFSYKGKFYPLMTHDRYCEITRSRIWESPFVDDLWDFKVNERWKDE